ncbi:MAG: acyl-CoA synthetase [Myxococcota bacterium]|nr:acyl-CoA synthetase [Myxococcota bacterium]
MTAEESWNYGDILDEVGAALPPDAPALIHEDQRIGWGELTRRANALAAALIERGAKPDDKVAFYLRNRPEYLIGLFACFKARLVHVNVNFRYRGDELHYIFDNSDARFAIYDAEFRENVEKLRPRLPGVEHWLECGDGPTPGFAERFETLATSGDGARLDIERSPDDLLFIYTGGTTGMPKGVMWRQGDIWGALTYGRAIAANGGEAPASIAELAANVRRFGPGTIQMPACPLMHGTGLLTAINNMSGGGCTVTLPGAHFDPEHLFDAVEREGVNQLVIVGDAFAKPMLNALRDNPGRWKLDSLQSIVSSGVMWSREVKQGMLEHHPGMLLADMFGSSEAVGFGSSVTTADKGEKTAKFVIGVDCRVFTEDHRPVEPGSGERGFIARRGPIPVGYYKDPEKSAKTFPTIDGVRYSVPGDWCTVEADGTLTLLGRGSACINTAGEKVHPEEVEEVLKTHPDVDDALVVGVPDEKWGSAVTGVVQPREASAFDEAALREHVRERLAGYKTPKRIFPVEKMFRAPNGKADYKGAAAFARRESSL